MVMCKKCGKDSSRRNTAYLKTRKKEGLCVRCGDLRLGMDCTGTMCADCARKQREYNRNRKILAKGQLAS